MFRLDTEEDSWDPEDLPEGAGSDDECQVPVLYVYVPPLR